MVKNARNWLHSYLYRLWTRLHRFWVGSDGAMAMGPGLGRYAYVRLRGRRIPIVGENGLVRVHELKCWPAFFSDIVDGTKTFDLRRANDRDFQVDDILRLREWDPSTRAYTGRMQCVRITYILDHKRPCALSPVALNPNFCILGISMYWKNETKVIEGREWDND